MAKKTVKRVGKTAPVRGSVKRTQRPKDINEYANLWEQTETPEPGRFGALPDGKYTAEIEEALYDAGTINWVYKILDEGFVGRKAFQNTQLDNEVGVQIAKGNLQILELPIPDKIADMPESLAQATGLKVEITVRTRYSEKHGKDFTNTFLNSRLDGEGDVSGDDDDAGAATPAKVRKPAKPAVAEEPEAQEIVKGSRVSFADGKNTLEGEVTKVKGNNFTVDVDGEEWDVYVSELTLVQEEAPAGDATDVSGDIEVGSNVSFDCDGETHEGEVSAINDDGTYDVKVGEEVWGVPQADCSVVEKKAARKVEKKVVKKKF